MSEPHSDPRLPARIRLLIRQGWRCTRNRFNIGPSFVEESPISRKKTRSISHMARIKNPGIMYLPRYVTGEAAFATHMRRELDRLTERGLIQPPLTPSAKK